jgi:hypothetical protein
MEAAFETVHGRYRLMGRIEAHLRLLLALALAVLAVAR